MELSEKAAWHLLKSLMAVSSVSATHSQVWLVTWLRNQVSGLVGRRTQCYIRVRKHVYPVTLLSLTPTEKKRHVGILDIICFWDEQEVDEVSGRFRKMLGYGLLRKVPAQLMKGKLNFCSSLGEVTPLTLKCWSWDDILYCMQVLKGYLSVYSNAERAYQIISA